MWLNGSAGALRSGRRSYPYRPGYALVGRVAAVGPGFSGLPVGGRVFAMKPHGSHAVLGRQEPWVALPDRVADEDAAAIALTATALQAIHRSGMTDGDAAMVAGLGALGFTMIQVLAATFAGPVIALTGSAEKVALALRHGASAALTYDALPDRRAALLPVRTAFECSGAAANIARVLPLVGERGEMVAAGFYNDPIALDGEALFARELTVKAVRSIGAGDERARNVAEAGALVVAGKVRARHLVTHRFPAAQFDEAYKLIADRQANRRAIRVSLLWREAA